MSLVEILLLGVGLSLDTFAVSLSLGMACEATTRAQKIRFLVVIGLSHFVMILTGWLIGENLSHWIATYDHWIAFALLAYVGANMLKEGFSSQKSTPENPCSLLSLRNTLMLGIALSMDALITGFSLGLVRIALLEASQWVNILLSAWIIGMAAFGISAVGIFIGKKSSGRLGAKAELFGGVILIVIGLKVLFDHLGSGA